MPKMYQTNKLMFYHLKTRRRVNFGNMVSNLKPRLNIGDTLISQFPFFIKSRKKGLITEEHIVTDTHLTISTFISSKMF